MAVLIQNACWILGLRAGLLSPNTHMDTHTFTVQTAPLIHLSGEVRLTQLGPAHRQHSSDQSQACRHASRLSQPNMKQLLPS